MVALFVEEGHHTLTALKTLSTEKSREPETRRAKQLYFKFARSIDLLEFLPGSCVWASSRRLEKKVSIKWTNENFETELALLEGTLAQVFELLVIEAHPTPIELVPSKTWSGT